MPRYAIGDTVSDGFSDALIVDILQEEGVYVCQVNKNLELQQFRADMIMA